ncbi:MAG: bifunctional nuclease family protein [Planctomycetota bacterium]
MVEVELARILINEHSDQQIIYLREKNGKRIFPIVIGIFEALAINRIINQGNIERPLTHELIIRMLNSLNIKITRCYVNDLKDNTYFALLSLEHDGKTVEIDARPSDSITLALHENAPIFVDDSIMNQVAETEDNV